MREFQTQFQGFQLGLRRYAKNPRNNQYLTQCYNARVGRNGLEEYTSIISPFVGLPTLSHPFPQLVPTTPGRYLATASTIYIVNGDWSLTQKVTGITGSRVWHVADFGAWQVWTNGTKLVERNYSTGAFTISAESYTVRSVCNFRQQLIAGGISSGRDNQVFYSPIGSGSLATLLSYDGRDPTAGMIPMTWNGSVYVVKPLGKGVIVYGSAGITAIIPTQDHYSKIVHAFGRVELAKFGIAGYGAVAGDEKEHIFVDEGGKVWKIGEDFKLLEIGFDEYLSPLLLSGTLIGSFDPNQRDFYFTNGTTSFIITDKGMSSIFQLPTSLEFTNGGLIGVRGENVDTSCTIVSDILDFGNRGIKTISGVELGGTWSSTALATLQVAIDYRYDTKSSFTRSTFKSVTHEGFCVPMVSGVEFRLVVKSSSYVGFSIDYAQIRWKQSDKRIIRGTYAVATPQAASQSNS